MVFPLSKTPQAQKPQLTASSATSRCSTAAILSKVPPEEKLKTLSSIQKGSRETLPLFNWGPSVSTRERTRCPEKSDFSVQCHRACEASEHLRPFWLERKSSWLTDRVWSRSMPSPERAEAQGGECPADGEPQTWKPPRYGCPQVRFTLFFFDKWSHLTAM